MIEKKLTITDYGIFILSPIKLKEFLKDNKNKTKKILDYFQKNHDLYIKALEYGVWVPILPINSIKYIIKVSNFNEEFDDNWEQKFTYSNFNLSISSDNCFWVGSFGNLLNWNSDLYINTNESIISYQTLDGILNNKAFKYELESNNYVMEIKGFKRKQLLDYPNANFGFQFTFKKVDSFDGFKDPREDDKYNFNVAQM